jgi:LysM repeat protein
MTTGAKILLAVIGLFTGCLIIYYGFFLGAGSDEPVVQRDPAVVGADLNLDGSTPDEEATPADPPPARTLDRRDEGMIGEAVSRAMNGGGAPLGREEPVVGDVGPVSPASDPPRARRNPPPDFARPTSTAPPADSDGGKDVDVSKADPLRTTPPASTGGTRSNAPQANQPATLAPPKTTPAAVEPKTTAPPPQRTTTPPPARRTPAPPATTRYTTYVVRSGDTLSGIAQRWFGDSSKWDLIASANPDVDPDRLQIGATLRMPPKTAIRRSAPPAPSNRETTYIVRSQDTLSSIAADVYGDAKYWRTIFDANRSTIGSDPDRLKVGMKLVIPKRSGR